MFASYYGQAKPSAPVVSRRKVFSNAMVAHVWAQQTHSEGRSGNGNFYFEGATIYSYGTHFPIARFTGANIDGQRVVLFNSETRSISTSGHQRYTQAALDGLGVRLFTVPSVAPRWGDIDHNANVSAYVTAFQARTARMAKPHVQVWHGYSEDGHLEDTCERRLDSIACDELRAYCAAFGIACPAIDVAGAKQKIRDAFARYNDPKRVAKREASQASKVSRHWKTASNVAAFLEGVSAARPNLHFVSYDAKSAMANAYGLTSWGLESRIDTLARSYQPRHVNANSVTPAEWLEGRGGIAHHIRAHVGTLVRRKGDKLETSRGAECPFAHAVIAFVKAQDCRATGTTWQRNGQQIRVGHFNVDSIDAQGNLSAGCHTIEYAEMLRLAIREVPHMVKPCFGLPAVSRV